MDLHPLESRPQEEICIDRLESMLREPDSIEQRETIERLIAKIYKKVRKRRRAQQSALRSSSLPRSHSISTSVEAAACYACKKPVASSSARDSPTLCGECVSENQTKRTLSLDLCGRWGVVTGGRVKIGYATALRLLRWGSSVAITTRFPRDATQRFRAEADYHEWRDRLLLYQADFRDLGRVTRMLHEWNDTLPALDFLINNGAISVKESTTQMTRLREREAKLAIDSNLLSDSAVSGERRLANPMGPEPIEFALRQWVMAGGQDVCVEDLMQSSQERWTQTITHADPIELLEMLLVNAQVPYMLASQLIPLFRRSVFQDRYIVNVTGADGRFAPTKPDYHPQLNMSKAALNMMTRTSAAQLARHGIYMNSVDTGWITDWKRSSNSASRIRPPLDAEDGASRIVDPIVRGVRGTPVWGVLWRHYREARW